MSKNGDDVGEAIGVVLVACVAVALFALAVMAIISLLGVLISAGAGYGALNAIANYVRAFSGNVRFERVP